MTVLAVVAALSLTALVSASASGTSVARIVLRNVSIGVATIVLTFLAGSLVS